MKIRHSHKFIARLGMLIVALAIGLGTCFSTATFADGGYTLTFSVKENTTHTMTADTQNNEIIIDGQHVSLQNGDTNIAVACNSSTSCTITATSNTVGELNFNGNNQFSLRANGQIITQSNNSFSSNTNIQVEDYTDPDSFDGHAWFIWNCGGNICKHEFTELSGPAQTSEGQHYYPINMIKASDVTDGANTIDVSSLAQRPDDYAWVPTVTITELTNRNYTTWSQYQGLIGVIAGERGVSPDDWDLIHEYYYEGMGARQGVYTINTNANRVFRATIYDENNYEGIQFGVNEDSYYYYPSSWDPAFMDSTIELSGSTLDHPAEYMTYLEEPILLFRDGEGSIAEITSITPIGINPKAVTISSGQSDGYSIQFNSNFYDSVKFKITTANSTYYLLVHRSINNVVHNFREARESGASTFKYGLGLMYDSESSYADFQVIANITYADGSTRTIEAIPTAISYEDMEGNSSVMMESPAGKNLNTTAFLFDTTSDMTDVNFTVIKNGALSGSTYGGTVAGSGRGVRAYDKNKVEFSTLIRDFYGQS